jgi:hypothetical protein
MAMGTGATSKIMDGAVGMTVVVPGRDFAIGHEIDVMMVVAEGRMATAVTAIGTAAVTVIVTIVIKAAIADSSSAEGFLYNVKKNTLIEVGL